MDRALLFADEAKIDKKLAVRIVNKLYEKGFDAAYFESVLWKLECMIRDGKLADLLNEASDEEIDSAIVRVTIEDGFFSEVGNYTSVTKVWAFADFEPEAGKVYAAKDTVEMQIMRTGKWSHPLYGEVVVSETTIDQMIQNFNTRARGIDICVDENHEPDHKALAWYRELKKVGKDSLFAVLELTAKGAELLNEGAYRYFSPEFITKKVDEESGETIFNLLTGGAFTNRPFFKDMQPLMASEGAPAQDGNDKRLSILFLSDSKPMNQKFHESVGILLSKKDKITDAEMAACEAAFAENKTPSDSDKAMFEAVTAKFKEPEKKPEAATVPAWAQKYSEADIQGFIDKANKGAEAEMRLSEIELTGAVNGLVFSETNKAGRFKSDETDEVRKFMESLNKDQRVAFAELVKKIPTVAFGEIGEGGGDAGLTAAEQVDTAAKKLVKDSAGKMKYTEAVVEVKKNDPALAKRYKEESLKGGADGGDE